jgi:hypothetical protein
VHRLAATDELLEMRLALHADVFVDRHRQMLALYRPAGAHGLQTFEREPFPE